MSRRRCHLRRFEERFQVRVSKLFDFNFDFEPGAMFVFDVLGGAQAWELAIDHDADFCAEGLGFIHWMGREDDRWLHVLNRYFWDNLLHDTASLWINTSWGLVQQYNWRVPNQSDGQLDFALVTSRKIHSIDIWVPFETHLADHIANNFGLVLNAFQCCVDF